MSILTKAKEGFREGNNHEAIIWKAREHARDSKGNIDFIRSGSKFRMYILLK